MGLKSAILAVVIMAACVNEQEVSRTAQPTTGACVVSSYSVGTWYTTCWQDMTSTGCDGMENVNTISAHFLGKTCQQQGYAIKCPTGLYKASACLWFE